MGKEKILIATAFPTHGAGSGALVTTQAKSYVEDGHEVHIITGNNRTNFGKLPNVQYHVVPFTAETENAEKIEGRLPFNYLMFTTHTESTANFWNVSLKELEQYCASFRKALVDEVNTFNPDVIHAQHNWLLSSIATEMGKPVVTTIHGTDLMGYEKSKLKLAEVNKEICDICTSSKEKDMSKDSEMKKTYLYDERKKYEFYISEAEKSARESDKIIVISDAQKQKFIELFPFAKDKVVLLENGYDSKVFYMDSNVKREEVIPSLTSDAIIDGKIDMDYDTLVLFVGKFADFKGIDSLLISAKIYETEMKKEDKKILTLIVGSGALEDTLKAQAKQLELENTHFVGRKTHDVICKLQNLADVSVIPSRDEPFGLVVIEGTACGHPVIGSNSGGIQGILNVNKETLGNEDIIKTPLGVLTKPLPNRPETLTDKEKSNLDILTTEYVVTKDKEKVIQKAVQKFNVSKDELRSYFEEYEKSTLALAKSVLKIARGEITFDNKFIHDYTEKTYSQDIIRDKLIAIFDEAKTIFKEKNR